MFVRRFFEPALAQYSYLIGCQATGDALIVDPVRDVAPYVAAAAEEGLRITQVTETHIHADFASGSRQLAADTGAALLISGAGGEEWQYAFAADPGVQLLRDGDRFLVGRVRVDVRHTPGHTPEHLTFFITDTAAADQPIAALTGDFLFVGDVGRPDLLERAVGVVGSMETSARVLYRSLRAFAAQPEWLQIWPGHGAGSACGKGISAIPHSTLGYERQFNWAFRVADEDEFVTRVLEGQVEPPAYFAAMKRLNQAGVPPLLALPTPSLLPVAALTDSGERWPDAADRAAQDPSARPLVVDARPIAQYGTGFVPGSINIAAGSSFLTWVGTLVPFNRRVRLVVPGRGPAAAHEAARLARLLALIGFDSVDGYFDDSVLDPWLDAGQGAAGLPQVHVEDVAESLKHGGMTLIDVRTATEYADGHIAGARHVPLAQLTRRVGELPRTRPVVVQCLSGVRSGIAASVLRAAGVPVVLNFAGGLAAWTQAGRDVVR